MAIASLTLKRTDISEQIVDKALNRLITHVDDLIMRVHNLLVQLDEVKGLAFYAIFPAVYVDEDS